MTTFFENAHTDPLFDIHVFLSECAMEEADQARRINMINDTYNVNIACAEHKVLTESGTYDDLAALFEAAEQEKEQATEGLWQKFLNWLHGLGQKMQSSSTKKECDALNEQAKADPNKDVSGGAESHPEPGFLGKIIGWLSEHVLKIIQAVSFKQPIDAIKSLVDTARKSMEDKFVGWTAKKFGFAAGVVSAQAVAAAATVNWDKATGLNKSIHDKLKDLNKKTKDPSYMQQVMAIIRGFASWVLGYIIKAFNFFTSAFKKVKDKAVDAAGKVKDKVAGKKGNDKNAAPAPQQDAAPQETTAESVTVFGIDFDREDYTMESVFDSDCSDIVALLDRF